MPENGRQNGADPESLRKLFIGGLSLETTEESMKAFYEQWGTIPDIVIMKDGITKKSRGFGFVTYDKAESVDEAMRNRPHEIDGKQVDPKRAVPREFSSNPEYNVQVKKLYIGGIKDDHTEEQVRKILGEFGEIEEVSLVDDKNTGKRRGFGFVTFADFDPVDKACLLKTHMIGGHQCNVKKALSRDEQARVQQKRDRMGRDFRAGGPGSFGGRGGGRGAGRGRGGGGYGGGDFGGGRGAGYGAAAGGWGAQAGGYGGGGYGGGGYGYDETYGGGYPGGYGGAAGYGAAAAGGWGQGGQYGGGQQIGGSWGQSW